MLLKRITISLFFLLLLIIKLSAQNTNYYIDSISGNDINTGKNINNAWKTLNKVNATIFQAGDSVLFKSG